MGRPISKVKLINVEEMPTSNDGPVLGTIEDLEPNPPGQELEVPILGIFKTHNEVELPKFATEQSACFDIAFCRKGKPNYSGYTITNKMFTRDFNEAGIYIGSQERVIVPTGLIFDIPKDYSLRIHIRSSLALKRGLFLANAEGVIDSDYFHESFIVLYNASSTGAMIGDGERIAQAELVKLLNYKLAQSLVTPSQKTDRVGGYGSTGV
jgi:dUTP pyrophosphatase